MLRWLIKQRISAFESRYGYDAAYLHALADEDTKACFAVAKVGAMAKYQHVPPAVFHAVKLTTTLHEDCGPCTQLCVAMAHDAGVPADVIRAVLAGELGALPEEAALGVRFARAVLARGDIDVERVQIVEKWGKRGLISLAFALTTARIYPTLKWALGYGHVCVRVEVEGIAMTPARAHA